MDHAGDLRIGHNFHYIRTGSDISGQTRIGVQGLE